MLQMKEKKVSFDGG